MELTTRMTLTAAELTLLRSALDHATASARFAGKGAALLALRGRVDEVTGRIERAAHRRADTPPVPAPPAPVAPGLDVPVVAVTPARLMPRPGHDGEYVWHNVEWATGPYGANPRRLDAWVCHTPAGYGIHVTVKVGGESEVVRFGPDGVDTLAMVREVLARLGQAWAPPVEVGGAAELAELCGQKLAWALRVSRPVVA